MGPNLGVSGFASAAPGSSARILLSSGLWVAINWLIQKSIFRSKIPDPLIGENPRILSLSANHRKTKFRRHSCIGPLERKSGDDWRIGARQTPRDG